MNTPSEARSPVRQMLATRTRQVHLELHEHPWIASLAHPQLTLDKYCAVLSAYHGFYKHIEQACSAHPFPHGLSLHPATERLATDINGLEAHHHHEPTMPVDLHLQDPVELLGALYVLHGSSFGATILNRNVRDVLPEAPRHFLGAGNERDSWKQLTQELERFNNDELAQEKLSSGATATFLAFGLYVTACCESRLPMQNLAGAL